MEPFDELTTRRERLDSLIKSGVEPYQSSYGRTHEIAQALAEFENFSADQLVGLTGRIIARRAHGGSTFMNINDGTAAMQIYFKKDNLGEGPYAALDRLDVGDFIEVMGTAFVTKKGEKSILVSEAPKMLAKALRPLPEKWHGLSDVEIRYRKRYLDLLANQSVKDTALVRSSILRHMRDILNNSGFVEVETPILQVLAGGATAKPFITHHNVLDIDLYLRIAPELYLKRLLVGGFSKVFEVARCFRNEGIDHAHNPEFTQIELYEAYSNYELLMTRLENLMVELVMKTKGSLVTTFDGQSLDFTPPYPRLDWLDVLDEAVGIRTAEKSDQELRQLFRQKGIEILDHEGRGAMLDAAYKKLVRPNIIQPTFLINHPLELSPLAKKHSQLPNRTERFQLVLGGGVELMNGFSELNDPLDQRARFVEQEKLRANGDEEAQRIDEDYIEALEYGMPPAAGVGIGIDRLVAVLTDSHSLKEVILFPTLRPKLE